MGLASLTVYSNKTITSCLNELKQTIKQRVPPVERTNERTESSQQEFEYIPRCPCGLASFLSSATSL